VNIIKDIIVDALSCASDNAHDMGVKDCSAYAVGVITMEIICGDSEDIIDCGYFDTASFNAGLALEEDRLTRDECRPHLTEAVNEFLKTEGDDRITTNTGIKMCECDEPENETRDGGRTVVCVICGGE
jgi:hypothetical protein